MTWVPELWDLIEFWDFRDDIKSIDDIFGVNGGVVVERAALKQSVSKLQW